MDEDMWLHPSTKANLEKLGSYGNSIIPVDKGELASGLVGDGRMAEPEQIIEFINSNFFLTRPLAGKKALVTAGPTYEAIDPVRFIGNYSSGKMGIALAKELHKRGAEVNLVLGPVANDFSANGISVTRVTTAEEMFNASNSFFDSSDIAIMAAAVADFKPVEEAAQKIKKADGKLTIDLTHTTDILESLGKKKKPGQVLIGFALETNNEKENAMAKLKKKKADMIVMNSLNDPGAGFGHDTNKVTLFDKGGTEIGFDTQHKTAIAKNIVDTIIRLYYA